MASGIEIFIDESGDFGQFDARCPYYIVTMVFHETTCLLFSHISELEYRLSLIGLEAHCIHSSPAVRGEHEYHGIDLATRRKTLPVFSRIFQMADYVCTMNRLAFKLRHDGCLSKSETRFFGNIGNFRKKWLKPLMGTDWRQ